MSMNIVTLLYLVASVFFIQALKGLSHPTTSIRGNLFGMTGMTIAVLTNDSDPDGDPLSVGSFTQGAHGTVTLNVDGTFTLLEAARGFWSGLDDAAKVMILWFAAFVPSVINSFTGVRNIDMPLLVGPMLDFVALGADGFDLVHRAAQQGQHVEKLVADAVHHFARHVCRVACRIDGHAAWRGDRVCHGGAHPERPSSAA